MDFELAPASTGVLATLWGLGAFMLALCLMFLWIAWSASHGSVTVRDGTMQLKVPFYGRSIPLASLDLEQASIVDLHGDSPLRPTLRTNGIGLPGYGVGWFRLRNGSRALVAVAGRKDLLYLPTREGYVLLLGLKEPHGLLAQLEAKARR